jgi:cytochrome P450
MTDTAPVGDWSTDYDIFDPGYVEDPLPVWKELRGTCPIAHTERWGGSWLPTRHADVQAMAKIVPELSSTQMLVTPQSTTRNIHRCAGSNLARLEMDIALRTWFARIPEFEISDPSGVTWAGGQVRGPRTLPMRLD